MPARRVPRLVVGLLAASALTVTGCARGCRTQNAEQAGLSPLAARLLPGEARLAAVSPELRQRLAQSPHALFRFLNEAWMREVCHVFADDFRSLPAVRLHGDAHVEQYAVTKDARGLDDFDDSATGPAVVDLVRFLGSVELTAHQRGWDDATEAARAELFSGYRRALQDPTYLPPDPAVVTRLRAAARRSGPDFLVWAESLMQPFSPRHQAALEGAWPKAIEYARQADPSLNVEALKIKRAGWLRLGIGSALAAKFLVRLEGPSPAPDDDLIVEGKEVGTLKGIPCLTIPASGELFRVVEGLTQVGRLGHKVLVVVPIFPAQRPDARGWWVKTWEPSYRELEISDLASPQELAEIAHDVGAQLGSANLLGSGADGLASQKRLLELEGISRLEPRVRQAAHDLAEATVQAWERFRSR